MTVRGIKICKVKNQKQPIGGKSWKCIGLLHNKQLWDGRYFLLLLSRPVHMFDICLHVWDFPLRLQTGKIYSKLHGLFGFGSHIKRCGNAYILQSSTEQTAASLPPKIKLLKKNMLYNQTFSSSIKGTLNIFQMKCQNNVALLWLLWTLIYSWWYACYRNVKSFNKNIESF